MAPTAWRPPALHPWGASAAVSESSTRVPAHCPSPLALYPQTAPPLLLPPPTTDLLDFFTNRTAEAPQQCCFTFGLGAPGVTASLCLQSGTNVTADVADSPVTQAASYQLPVCSYQDPLGRWNET